MICALLLPLRGSAQDMPLFRWENFTTANGLPDNHVFCVLVDGKRIWAGTENGLGLYENGKWKVLRPVADRETSLAHQAVLSLALDKRTGDVWAGTMGGLSRVSAGRIDTFTQLNFRSEQRHRLRSRRTGRLRLDRDCRRRQPPEHAHRTVVPVQRAQHPHVRDLDLLPSAPPMTRSTTRSGAAACSSTT